MNNLKPSSTPTKKHSKKTMFWATIVDTTTKPYVKTNVGAPQHNEELATAVAIKYIQSIENIGQ